MDLKALAKRLVAGTPMERSARAFAKLLPGTEEVSPEDQQTLALMNGVLSVDSNCVDVGCHKGFFLRYMLDAAPRGRHFAFEPIPVLFQKLANEHYGTTPESMFAYFNELGCGIWLLEDRLAGNASLSLEQALP